MGKYLKNPYIEGLPGRWYRCHISWGRETNTIYVDPQIAKDPDNNIKVGTNTANLYLDLNNKFQVYDCKVVNANVHYVGDFTGGSTIRVRIYYNGTNITIFEGSALINNQITISTSGFTYKNIVADCDVLVYGAFQEEDI